MLDTRCTKLIKTVPILKSSQSYARSSHRDHFNMAVNKFNDSGLYMIEGNHRERELGNGFQEAMNNLSFKGLTEILNVIQ